MYRTVALFTAALALLLGVVACGTVKSAPSPSPLSSIEQIYLRSAGHRLDRLAKDIASVRKLIEGAGTAPVSLPNDYLIASPVVDIVLRYDEASQAWASEEPPSARTAPLRSAIVGCYGALHSATGALIAADNDNDQLQLSAASEYLVRAEESHQKAEATLVALTSP